MTAFRSSVLQSARDAEGFTLIELLVSLVLLALILLGLPPVLRLTTRTLEISNNLDRIAGRRSALDYIEQRLAQAMPLYKRGDDGRLQIYFSGQPDSVSFISPSPVGPIGGGLYRFELKAKETEEGQTAIVLGWTLYQATPEDPKSPPPSGERVLLTDAGGFGLRYYGRRKDNTQPDWGDSWTRNDTLPDLVEVRTASQGSGSSTQVVELRLRPTP